MSPVQAGLIELGVLHPNFSFLNYGPSLYLSLYTYELRRRNSYRPAPPGGQPAPGVPHLAIERLASLRQDTCVRTGRRAHAETSLQNAPTSLQDHTPTFPEKAPHTDTRYHLHPLAHSYHVLTPPLQAVHLCSNIHRGPTSASTCPWGLLHHPFPSTTTSIS